MKVNILKSFKEVVIIPAEKDWESLLPYYDEIEVIETNIDLTPALLEEAYPCLSHIDHIDLEQEISTLSPDDLNHERMCALGEFYLHLYNAGRLE